MIRTPFQIACDELKALGLVIEELPGEYRVNFRNAPAENAYRTDDLEAAVARGREMAAQPPAPADPPLGPTGPRSRRRSMMYRHNRKLAERRRKSRKKGVR